MQKIICCTTIGLLAISGCSTGSQYAANTYTANSLNQRQETTPVAIIATSPAKVHVDNEQGKKTAMIAGTVLGALAGGAIGHGTMPRNTGTGALVGGVAGAGAGSLVPDTVSVDGVTITYTQDRKTYSSTQVGRMCEFVPGPSIMISMSSTETRIQPNAECPKG